MIGLVLVTHGRLAAEFITALEHVVGPQEAIEAVCIGPDDDMEARRKDIAEAIGNVDSGDGTIVLTDLFGGTPSNLAISLMKSENVEVIAGVNVPMLIRLESARKVMGIHAAVTAAREAGRKYISVASEILGEAAASTSTAKARNRRWSSWRSWSKAASAKTDAEKRHGLFERDGEKAAVPAGQEGAALGRAVPG
jgi:PTS system mannose-specific IIA component